MLSRIGTFFLYLLSLLPFWVLYLVADILFFILYYITGYRRKVVQENLRNSFPEKSDKERRLIEKKYFKYMADLMMETIKCVSMPAKDVKQRMTVTNPEVVEQYFNRGKCILAATAHYGNWELACLRFGFTTDKKRLIVYKPQSNQVFTDFFNRTRSRFGSEMISMKQTLRKMIQYKDQLFFAVFASDQAPVREDSKYFTTFLNQPTAVFLGVEKLSKMINSVVVFYQIEVVKRGYYSATIVPLCDEPKETRPYEITEAHVKYLESMIREKPEYWLWSHRRWKIKPEDIQQ